MTRQGRDDNARRTVLARANGRCEAQLDGCTGSVWDLHHRYPPGRIDTVANLVAVCRQCHETIHATRPTSDRSGLLISKISIDGGLPDRPYQKRPT